MNKALVGIEHDDLHRVREADGSALWCAVIYQAIRDATHNGAESAIDPNRKRDAREWLTTYDRDFELVCQFAGLEPEHVRSAAVKLIGEADQHPQTFKLDTGRNRSRSKQVCDAKEA